MKGTNADDHPEQKYAVMLPCSPEDFGDFIGSLLGQPQTIERNVFGAFEIDHATISNFFHLVEQRVHQQNDATLVQFTVKVVYTDDSSVLLNSLADFEAYNEVHSKVCASVHLSWVYLVKFMRRPAPEKQVVEISFWSGTRSFHDNLRFVLSRDYSSCDLRISHTERTWGIDIESLLSGHLKTIVCGATPTQLFLSRHNEKVGLLAGSVFLVGAIYAVYEASNLVVFKQMESASAIAANGTTDLLAALTKIEYLVSVVGSGVWPRFTFAALGFLFVCLIISIVLAIIVGEKLSPKFRGFILLTKDSRQHAIETKKKDGRRTFQAIMSVVGAVAVGVAANMVYTKFFI